MLIYSTPPVRNISVLSDRAAQRSRVQAYNDKIERFVVSAAAFYNNQVSEDVKVSKKLSPPESVKSAKRYASKLSVSAASTRVTGGICFTKPLVTPNIPARSTVDESNMPKPAQGDHQNETQPRPLTSATSTSMSSTVTHSVSGTTVNESLVAIMSSMERMSASHDLPHVQVQKFDGSPEQYPTFRQRFKQMVETKPLDDAVKMTRLLQFLEGPALIAVQRYEPLPGGLAKALKTLEDRFGQPFQVVRASVESLMKRPAIQANDKDSLQRYADMARVTYDTLESVGYLSEMNADNMEKVITRRPKWMQAKFAERLKPRE